MNFAIRAEDLDPLLTTEQRKLGQFIKQATVKGATIPGLDPAALSRRFSMDRAREPQLLQGTFRAPVGCSPDQFQRIAKDAVGKWVQAMDKQGWDWKPNLGWRVDPGVYPAHALDGTNTPDLGQREFIVRGHFCFRKPEPRRIEVPPELLKPTYLGSHSPQESH